ncbi:DUF4105 domain-containing protein [Leptospira idonii]|uniref:DUF4105 domain-containing protein n=1 Tax=Leptospira idonii TaxID=1193500 RepID=A0A4R9LWL5_9LEPT|nr:DUF4105 domain-containing protein [Leptospira idonii]TGN17603.1 DUF4105 domain-containing protein [Leptospira idonii]
MFKKLSLLLLVFFQIGLSAQSTPAPGANTPEANLIQMLSSIGPNQWKDVEFQLVTVSPSPTVTTAFGHSALRVLYGKPFESQDFYLDFGEYDESASFVWRFLKGEAKFFIKIRTMADAYTFWDRTGRGMVASQFILTLEQKQKFAKEILDIIEKKREGYEYDNFEANCVTFIRDILGNVYGKPLQLETEKNKSTWRSRLLPYAAKVFWLRFCEKLLLDHDTDMVRNPKDLIYLPYDLLIAAEDGKLVKDKELLHRDFWKLPESADVLGFVTFAIFIFLVASQIPGYLKQRFSSVGRKLFGIISVFCGTFTLIVILFTSFPFMNDTIMFLVFTPVDYLLFLKGKITSRSYQYFLYGRLTMLGLALLLRLTVLPQSIDAALFFTVLFFVLSYINFRKERTEELTETNA